MTLYSLIPRDLALLHQEAPHPNPPLAKGRGPEVKNLFLSAPFSSHNKGEKISYRVTLLTLLLLVLRQTQAIAYGIQGNFWNNRG